eukprot:gene2678-3323_t
MFPDGFQFRNDVVFLVSLTISDYTQSIAFSLLKSLTSLKELSLSFITFNFKIEPGSIPESVESLSLHMMDKITDVNSTLFVNSLQPGSIPSSVVDFEFDHILVRHDPHGIIPRSVQNIKVYNFIYVNGEKNLFPSWIKKLFIYSDEPIDNLEPECFQSKESSSIVSLYLSYSFQNQELKPGIIPDTVKNLNIGGFNNPMGPGAFPQALQAITFLGFSQAIDEGIIPDSVTSLSFYNYDHHLETISLPNSLKRLFTMSDFPILNTPKLSVLPLVYLSVMENFTPQTRLPQTLEHLECYTRDLFVNLLPSNLKTLSLHGNLRNIEVGSIPSSVTEMAISARLKISLTKGMIPTSVTKLSISKGIDVSVDFPFIPDSVKELYLTSNSPNLPEHPLSIGSIPSSVEILELGSCYNKELEQGLLPPNLKKLTISNKNIPFDKVYIPPSVQEVNFKFTNFFAQKHLTNIGTHLPQLNNNIFFTPKFRLRIWTYEDNYNYGYDDYEEEEEVDEEKEVGELNKDNYNLFQDISTFSKIVELDLTIKLCLNGEPITIPPNLISNRVEVLKLSVQVQDYIRDYDDILDGDKDIYKELIDSSYEKILEIGSIPLSVHTLWIDHKMFKHSSHILPSSVTDLTVFSWELNDIDDFDTIPESVKKLTVANVYNKQKTIPSSVKVLEILLLNPIGNEIVIPDSVEDLVLRMLYDGVISPGFIPTTLKSLKIESSNYFISITRDIIPRGLTKLVIHSNLNNNIFKDKCLPDSLTYLDCRENWDSTIELPQSLIYLECNFNRITSNLLPNGLQTLVLGTDRVPMIDIEIGSLPNSLTELEFYGLIEFPINAGILPSSLKNLAFHGGVTRSMPFPVIPFGVTHLVYQGRKYCYDNFDYKGKEIPNRALPQSIISLTLNDMDNQQLTRRVLPMGIQSLSISAWENINTNDLYIPPTIQNLTISRIHRSEEGEDQQDKLSNLLNKLLSQSKNQLSISLQFDAFQLLSFGQNDTYIYYKDKHYCKEGFVLKSKLIPFLSYLFNKD